MKLTKLAFLFACIVLFTNCEKADPIEEIKKEQKKIKILSTKTDTLSCDFNLKVPAGSYDLLVSMKEWRI